MLLNLFWNGERFSLCISHVKNILVSRKARVLCLFLGSFWVMGVEWSVYHSEVKLERFLVHSKQQEEHSTASSSQNKASRWSVRLLLKSYADMNCCQGEGQCPSDKITSSHVGLTAQGLFLSFLVSDETEFIRGGENVNSSKHEFGKYFCFK